MRLQIRLIKVLGSVLILPFLLGWRLWHDDIALVREGVDANIRSSISIGDVLESYPRCEKMRWDRITTKQKENVVQFDEVNCAALYCLPVSDLTLVAENLPTEISVKGYDGSVESKIRIEE